MSIYIAGMSRELIAVLATTVGQSIDNIAILSTDGQSYISWELFDTSWISHEDFFATGWPTGGISLPPQFATLPFGILLASCTLWH